LLVLGVAPIPLISVVIPAYNGEKTVLKTLSSIVGQDFSSLEVIVVDDGSRDLTISLVEDFLGKSRFSGNFVLIKHEKNQGLSKTLNDGIQRANGRYVLILHQDCEFVGDHWVEKAASFMDDERVGVVTGYYGIPDAESDTFVKRAFGVLRKQFHSRPRESCECVTFSEGKCDLYRKEALIKAGGFPTGYRIAGEDLVVSYRLRSMGYSIVKCYDLPVIQKFTGAAETFSGNLGKEFLFGKAAGGVFSQFRFFLFKDLRNSSYSRLRSLHRASQPFFVLALCFCFLMSWWFSWFVFLFVALLGFRYAYYFNKVVGELRIYSNRVKSPVKESLLVGLIGILTDFAYGFGFAYGLIVKTMNRRM